jgi:hypothetical protein
MIVIMDAHGTVDVGYLGTAPTQLRVASKSARIADYDAMEQEITSLYRQIHELTREEKSKTQSVMNVQVSLILTSNGTLALRVQNASKQPLLDVSVAAEEVPGLSLQQHSFRVARIGRSCICFRVAQINIFALFRAFRFGRHPTPTETE